MSTRGWRCIPKEWLLYEQHEVNNSDVFEEVMVKESRLAGARAVAHCHWLLDAAGRLTPESIEEDVVLCGTEYGRIMRMQQNIMDLAMAMARMVPVDVACRGDVRYAFQYGVEMPGKWACEHIMRLRLRDALGCDLFGRNADVDADRLLAWYVGRRIQRSEDFSGMVDGRRIKFEEKSDHSEWDLDHCSHFRPGYDDGYVVIFTHCDGLGKKGWAIPDVAVVRTWLIPGEWISEQNDGEFRFELVAWYDDKLAHSIPHSSLIEERPLHSECTIHSDEAEKLQELFLDAAEGDGWRALCQSMLEGSADARHLLKGFFDQPRRNKTFWRSRNGRYNGDTITLSDSERQELWEALGGSNSSETDAGSG